MTMGCSPRTLSIVCACCAALSCSGAPTRGREQATTVATTTRSSEPVVECRRGIRATVPEVRAQELIQAAREIIEASRYATLVTLDESGSPRGRIIDPFPPEEDMTVWFGTNPRTRKVRDIRANGNVTLVYFDLASYSYVSIDGVAKMVDDQAERVRRWKEGWEQFYPDREHDFTVGLIRPRRLEVFSGSRSIFGDPSTWLPPSVEFCGQP
jgi:general stress protein 26